MNVSLLPVELGARAATRRVRRRWIVALALTTVAAAGALAWRHLENAPLRARIAERRARHAALHITVETCANLERDAVSLSEGIAKLERLRGDSRALSVIGVVAERTRDCGGGVRLTRLETQLAPQVGAQPATVDASGNFANSAMIDGIGADPTEIARFVAGLRDAGVFQRVELKSSGEPQAMSDGGRKFQVECRF